MQLIKSKRHLSHDPSNSLTLFPLSASLFPIILFLFRLGLSPSRLVIIFLLPTSLLGTFYLLAFHHHPPGHFSSLSSRLFPGSPFKHYLPLHVATSFSLFSPGNLYIFSCNSPLSFHITVLLIFSSLLTLLSYLLCFLFSRKSFLHLIIFLSLLTHCSLLLHLCILRLSDIPSSKHHLPFQPPCSASTSPPIRFPDFISFPATVSPFSL